MLSTIRTINKVINKRPTWDSLGMLSSRSVVLLLCLVYLFMVPVAGATDIISAALSYGLLALLIVLALYTITFGFFVKRTLQVTLTSNEGVLYSGSALPIAISTTPVRIPPLLTLSVRITWNHPGVLPTKVSFIGRGRSSRTSIIPTVFPHRGVWEVAPLTCTFSDYFGLIQFRWTIPLNFALEILPPLTVEPSVPVISSSYRPGDLVTDTLNKEGDHYDLKRYHPSDGVKKIVWKVFAKRGELLSRHPEASITPEGYVLVFVCARGNDDDVASRALAYVEMLQELKIDVVASCEGANGREPATQTSSLLELLCESVWDAEESQSIQKDLAQLLTASDARTSSTRIDKVVIFCSERRFLSKSAEVSLHKGAAWLANHGITPMFVVSKERNSFPSRRTFSAAFSRIFTRHPVAPLQPTNPTEYAKFVSRCLQSNWEVLV